MSKRKIRSEMSKLAKQKVDVLRSDLLEKNFKVDISVPIDHDASAKFEWANADGLVQESNSPDSSKDFSFDEDVSENFSDIEPSLLDSKDGVLCVNCKGNLKKILDKVEGIERKVERIENLLTSMQSKDLETNKLLRSNLGCTKQASKLIKQLMGEEEAFDEINKLFPIETIADFSNIEERANEQKFTSTLTRYLRRFKSSEESIDKAFRHIAVDSVYQQFNLSGVAGKESLIALELFKKILYDACGSEIGITAYQNQLKKSVLRSHNRFFKKKRKLDNQTI